MGRSRAATIPFRSSEYPASIGLGDNPVRAKRRRHRCCGDKEKKHAQGSCVTPQRPPRRFHRCRGHRMKTITRAHSQHHPNLTPPHPPTHPYTYHPHTPTHQGPAPLPPPGVGPHNLHDDPGDVGGVEWLAQGTHFVQDAPQGPNVTLIVVRFTMDHLTKVDKGEGQGVGRGKAAWLRQQSHNVAERPRLQPEGAKGPGCKQTTKREGKL
jgi:hypothetical protein